MFALRGRVVNEYFIIANSFAAPFFSDTSEKYVVAEDHLNALNDFVKNYSHPQGLFAAAIYPNADAYHKDEKPLARWLSNKAQDNDGPAKEGKIVT